MKYNLKKDRHINEGWYVSDFINELEVTFHYMVFKNTDEIKAWCKSEQPYYKKHIPEVYNHFAQIFNLRK